MENKDFKCLHRRKEQVSKTVLLRKGENLGSPWREAQFASSCAGQPSLAPWPWLSWVERFCRGMFPHLSSCPSIHLLMVEHPSCEMTTTWLCMTIHVWIQEEKMLWMILDSCEFACFLGDKITDKSYPDPSCTYVLLGKANILISAPRIHGIWLAECRAYSSPLRRQNGRGSWSFEHQSYKPSLGQQENKWEDPQNMDLLKYIFLAHGTEIANDHSTLMLS